MHDLLQRKRNFIRHGLLMALGMVLNSVFHELAVHFNLPMWLDFTGTVLCSVVLEPAAGLLVGFADNFLLAVTQNHPGSIIYYAVSAAIALISGLCMRENGRVSARRIPITVILMVLVCSLLSTLTTFLVSNGVSNSAWELTFQAQALAIGIPEWLSLFYGVLLVKLCDVCVTTALVIVLWLILPPYLKFGPEKAQEHGCSSRLEA